MRRWWGDCFSLCQASNSASSDHVTATAIDLLVVPGTRNTNLNQLSSDYIGVARIDDRLQNPDVFGL
jgi:hypothetical protein